MTGTTATSSPTLVAAAVAACPAVAGLHAGPVGSYLPGARVAGVSLGEKSALIVVDLAYPATVAELEAQIREALQPLVFVPVDIEVADVVLPNEKDTAVAVTMPSPIPAVPTRSGDAV